MFRNLPVLSGMDIRCVVGKTEGPERNGSRNVGTMTPFKIR
ncbi:hypothetical protein LEP1GSC058_1053 [Leptospira fainei serovar Hurstbridge str. BUT 6]|uniref:Uncharacterized protein n=1 Tax=Leptospira fainei serovar Hurstbridge str. BUT 6 TaxID=1193011 RepID=S3V7W7_9LEPT|nr:hypothetical protein LEP1GSC058_1053 [Leptospira fainei serovar Hurstbridge str. BUT 6]